MIVTIDGPAGAGKSTVARALADRLGFGFLDTGAMYRAVALAGLRRGVDWDRQEPLAELAGRMTLQIEDRKLLLDGEDVTEAVRDSEVTAATRHAADNPQVRCRLVELQRRIAGRGNFVTEGRDQGTVVFPQAACKIFLTASAHQRASRRLADLQAQGETTTLDRVLADQQRRDREDRDRAVGALKPAEDAVEVNTDGMTLDQVVDHLESLVRKRA